MPLINKTFVLEHYNDNYGNGRWTLRLSIVLKSLLLSGHSFSTAKIGEHCSPLHSDYVIVDDLQVPVIVQKPADDGVDVYADHYPSIGMCEHKIGF